LHRGTRIRGNGLSVQRSTAWLLREIVFERDADLTHIHVLKM